MASAAQEQLFEIFVQVAGEQVSSLTSVVDSSQQLAGSLSEVVKQVNLTKSSAGSPAPTTPPVQSSSQHSDTGGKGPLGVVEDIASSVFRNALGAMPLVHGILSL